MNEDLTITGIENPQFGYENADFRIDNNQLLLSFNSTAKVAYDVNKPLFTLVTNVKANTASNDNFVISNDVLNSEVYNSSLEIVTPILTTLGDDIASFELYQNKPNPFKGSTEISFRLPNEMNASLTIRDITGKLVYSDNGVFKKGIHTIKIDQTQLSTSGILYYTLDAGQNSATKKMVVIE